MDFIVKHGREVQFIDLSNGLAAVSEHLSLKMATPLTPLYSWMNDFFFKALIWRGKDTYFCCKVGDINMRV